MSRFDVYTNFSKKHYKDHKEIIDYFLVHCSKRHANTKNPYKAPFEFGYFNSFRKLNRSNNDRKRGVRIDEKHFIPKVGEILKDIPVEFFNYHWENIRENEVEEMDHEYTDQEFLFLARKDIRFHNQSRRGGYVLFEYFLFVKYPLNKTHNKKALQQAKKQLEEDHEMWKEKEHINISKERLRIAELELKVAKMQEEIGY